MYRADNTDTVILNAYLAKTSLGQSTNMVVFGSERPPDVQDMPGYGQSAFWDGRTGTLSVLKNNNRYDISRKTGDPPSSTDQARVLDAANVIVPRL